MLSPTDERNTSKLTLGQYLASIRADRNLSLRDVEEVVDHQVCGLAVDVTDRDRKREVVVAVTARCRLGLALEALAEAEGVADRVDGRLFGFALSQSAR